MTSLQVQVNAYSAYHQDTRNKLTHFVGVPLVTFSVFVFLGWLRVVNLQDVPLLSGAALFYLLVFLYYLSLDWFIALVQAPITLGLLYLADRVSVLPFTQSLLVFGATFVGGWIIQLVGHAFEGKRPALADNIMQIFNAPLFLTVEVLLLLGIRKGASGPFLVDEHPASTEPIVPEPQGQLHEVRA
jgi:uncharacterized membrane protein YGL010W